MIIIEDLTAADIGRWVVYRYLDKRIPGRIKSWNQDSVWVVYQCNGEWDRFLDFIPMATKPADLDWSLSVTDRCS